MATSDLLKQERGEKAPVYAIIGAGGIKFTFSSIIYDRQTVEQKAISRAMALHCHLFRMDADGRIFQVHPNYGEVVRMRNGRNDKMMVEVSLEMFNNVEYIPGVQVNQ